LHALSTSSVYCVSVLRLLVYLKIRLFIFIELSFLCCLLFILFVHLLFYAEFWKAHF